MAYSYGQSSASEHPFKTIGKTMMSAQETGIWPRLMLLCGPEAYLIRWAEGYLRECAIEPATEALDLIVFEELRYAQDLINACETVPMLSVKKLVIVRDADLFGAPASEPAAADIAAYLPELPESTLLVFSAQKPNRSRALYKAIVKSGLVFDFTALDDATLAAWMHKTIVSFGAEAERRDLLDLAHEFGYGGKDSAYTLYELENDLRKAAALAADGKAGPEELRAAAPRRADTDAFALIDSAFSGRKSAAYEILDANIVTELPSRQTGVVLSFTGLLCSQLEIMLEGLERREAGQSEAQIASEMNVNSYRLKKALQAASRRGSARLRKDLCNAFQIEKDIKSGAMDPRMAIELFLAGL